MQRDDTMKVSIRVMSPVSWNEVNTRATDPRNIKPMLIPES